MWLLIASVAVPPQDADINQTIYRREKIEIFDFELLLAGVHDLFQQAILCLLALREGRIILAS